MPFRDLSGKTVYDLELEDFAKLFCERCRECAECSRDDRKTHVCRALVDSGLWDAYCRKNCIT